MYLCLQKCKSYKALISTEKYEGVYVKDNSILLCKCHSHSCLYRSPSLWKHLPTFIDTMVIVYCAFPSSSQCQKDKPLSLSGERKVVPEEPPHVSGTSTGKFWGISFRWSNRTALSISGGHDIMAVHVKYHNQTSILYAYTVNTSPKPWATSRKVHEKQNHNFKHLRPLPQQENVVNSTAVLDPLMAPIKDAGDESRRGCQSSKGPSGEQKAGGGVTQPWPGHNDQGLTLNTYHCTHASSHDTRRWGASPREEVEWNPHY